MTAAPAEGSMIRELRRGAGLTQAELALRVGTTQSAVARWERGAVAPSLRSLRSLTEACGHRLSIELDVEVTSIVTNEEVARLEANIGLTPSLRLVRATKAANFVLQARRALTVASDVQH